jgi:hypothetical protein
LQNPLLPGDLVQIDPAFDPRFGGCILLVTEVKSWGVQGAVRMPTADGAGDAYYRVPYAHCEPVGRAAWAPPMDDEADEEEEQPT